MNASLASDPAVRRSGIGGSDLAALVGESPFGVTPFDVFLEKRGEALPRVFSPEQEESIEWGNALEAPVADAFARRAGVRIARVNKTIVHQQYPFLIGHIDRRIVGAPEGVEVKTTSFFNGVKSWNVDEADDIPPHVMLQVQWYMVLTGFARFHVPVLIGGQRLKVFVVERDPAMGEMLVAIAVEFWQNHVLTGIAPDATSAEEVRRRYPIAVTTPIEATEEVRHALAVYVDAKAREKAAASDADSAADIIAAHLTEHDTLTIFGQPALTFKTQSSQRVDIKGFRAAYPDLCERFTQASTTRVMRVAKGFKA